MHLFTYLIPLTALAAPSLQAPQTSQVPSVRVFERLQTQRSASFDGMMNNIGGSGKSDANAPGASPGLVVASPTKENPKYGYNSSTLKHAS